MTLTPEQQALEDKYRLDKPSALTPEQQVLEDKYRLPSPSSDLSQFGKGVLTSLSNVGNFLAAPFLHPLGAHGPHYQIPVPAGGDPNRLAYGAGQFVAGLPMYIGTDLGLARAAEMGPRILKGLAYDPLVRSTISGAISSGALASPGHRGIEAGIGGLIAPLSVGVASGAGNTLKNLLRSPIYHKISNLLLGRLGKGEEPLTELGSEIANNYKQLRGISNQNYDDVFMGLRDHKMGIEDLENYERELNNIKNPKVLKKIDAPTIAELEKEMGGRSYHGVAGKIKKGLAPYRIHDIRSELEEAKRDALANNESKLYHHYSNLSNALHNDFEKYITKEAPNIFPLYREAQDFYKSRLVPFQKHYGANKLIKTLREEGELREPNGIEVLSRPGKELIQSNFVPKAKENVSMLHDLSRLLQSPEGVPNQAKAAHLSRNVMFNKAINPKTGEYDIDKYLKEYGKLGNKQKEFLFSPEEKAILDNLNEYDEKKSTAKGKALISQLGRLASTTLGGAILGEEVGPHLGLHGTNPGLIGAWLGLKGSPLIQKGVSRAAYQLLPNNLPRLNYMLMSRYHPGMIGGEILPAATTGLAHTISQNNL